MTFTTVGIIIFVLLLVLMAIGIPISTVMGILGIGGIAYILAFDPMLLKVAVSSFNTMNSYTYTVVPMFMLMATLIATTGVGGQLYDFFNKLVGHRKGGLAIATILACGVFAAISSSSIATSLTIGLIAYPQMRQRKYDVQLSASAIAAGGTLGCFIPPSGTLMIYGIMTEQSISKLLIGGIVPGIILMIFFVIVVQVQCTRNPLAGPPSEKVPLREALKSFKQCGETIVLIIIVLGGMFAGFFTPTEAGSVGVAGALVITLVRRKLTWSNFKEAMVAALKNAGMVYGILIGANILNILLALTGIPSTVASVIVGTGLGKYAILFIILAILMFLGCFIDSLAMLILTLPVLLPIVVDLGCNLIWFGVFMTAAVQLASITPPVGVNLFVTKGLADEIKISMLYKGIWPYVAALLLLVVIMIFFPDLVMWLPNLIKG